MPVDRPIRILLVEDDPAHAEIVRRSLSESSLANVLTHVEDGQAALDYLERACGPGAGESGSLRPDLVLLDLRLPKVDGLEVLRRIKAGPRTRAIPTVILTTSRAESDLVSAYDGGVGSYLVKPVDFARFTALLDSFGLYWIGCNEFPRRSPTSH